MIEFAITLPFLATILCGIMQYGFIFAAYMTLHNASVAAVRFATLSNPQPTVDKIKAVAKGSIAPLLEQRYLRDPNVNMNYPVGGVAGAKRVELTYDLTLFLPFVVPQRNGNTMAITVSAIMR